MCYSTSLLRSLSASGQINKSCAGPGGMYHWANATAKVTHAETRVSRMTKERNLRDALKMFYCNVHALFLCKKMVYLCESLYNL